MNRYTYKPPLLTLNEFKGALTLASFLFVGLFTGGVPAPPAFGIAFGFVGAALCTVLLVEVMRPKP